jgi:hypothetical protein
MEATEPKGVVYLNIFLIVFAKLINGTVQKAREEDGTHMIHGSSL